MQIDQNEIPMLISEINKLYAGYQSLSNDELRETVAQIEVAITQSNDKEQALAAFLPPIFALVKETARRFTLGDVIVTANDFDHKLADKFDFVDIEGGKAIYHDHWFAGGNQFEWKMVHYDEQIMGGIMLHRGFVAEMATGEGKTLMATLPVFLNALTHKGVHIMTVNEYLSKRDCEQTRPIYMFHGLSVDCIEYSSLHNIKRKSAYKSDITFGTNSNFAFDYLCDHLTMLPDECVQFGHNFAVIDELDSILIDDADNPHIISGGDTYNVGKDFQDKKGIIEELLATSDDTMFQVDPLKHKAWFTEEGERWLSNKCQIEDLFNVKKIYHIDKEKQPSEEQLSIRKNLHIQNILQQLLNAYTLYQLDIDYIIANDSIVIVDHHTGRLREKSRWEHGLHTAVEVKEKIRPKNDNNGMAVISLKNYFKLYTKLCGMTGTVMPVAEELKNDYNLNSVVIPTHRPLIRRDMSLRVFRTKEEKDKAIVETIETIHNNGRPILVGCLSIKRAEEICDLLTAKNLPHNLLSAKNHKKEAYIISQAGIGNTITVSTSMAGRGTDIKLSDEALRNGGLAVIGTDLFESKRIDRQLKGRAGRQGDPGSSVLFASLEDFIVKNLPEEEFETLSDIASNIDSEEVSIDSVRSYIERAQAIREEFFFGLRKEAIQKDDMIAPYRYKFYQQRNSVLFNASGVNEILTEIIVNEQDWVAIDKHIHKLYQTANPIFSRSFANNKKRTKMSLPFSESMDLFTVVFEIEKVINNFESFKAEYIRQVILGSLDRDWKQFVQYLMNNLDETEVKGLPKAFGEMKKGIDRIILARLKYSVIPVGKDTSGDKNHGEQEKTQNEVSTKINKSNNAISLEAICPCGSGKKYCECHGSNIRNTKPNRRR